MSHNNVFWNQLLMRGDSIAGINPRAEDALEQVLAQLATLTEQYDRVFDPADQFEEYVAVNFCQALQRALTPQPAQRICRAQTTRAPEPAASHAPAAQAVLDNAPPQPAASPTQAPAPTSNSSAKAPDADFKAPRPYVNAKKTGKKPNSRKGKRR
ncbi:hypothetical protein DWB84_07520 [Saccharophagus sp. K07]|jgi:hypothetical protein|uniref:hypothetical protein n=1 Tax=Saccharophagus sp. K07 TaxID=2283636 RepID=UPI00165294DB|nr:hypothetical protein [Saccharophagus sp. K07]MBC6905305.1 hypothetical protein [Saccharophagus sp. K07]